MNIRRRKRTGQPDRRGATLVEFALVAPFLFFVLLGCMEFCRFYMMASMAEDAAYFAARHVMVPGATLAEGVAMGNDSLSAIGAKNSTTTVQAYNGTTLQNQIDADTTEIRVNISIPIVDNSFLGTFLMKNGNITKEVTLSTERFSGYFDGQTP